MKCEPNSKWKNNLSIRSPNLFVTMLTTSVTNVVRGVIKCNWCTIKAIQLKRSSNLSPSPIWLKSQRGMVSMTSLSLSLFNPNNMKGSGIPSIISSISKIWNKYGNVQYVLHKPSGKSRLLSTKCVWWLT